jgi:hypothetical protein
MRMQFKDVRSFDERSLTCQHIYKHERINKKDTYQNAYMGVFITFFD